MRKIIVTNNLTLDGVMQSPGRPDEDQRGGFKHGGWALPYNDAVKGQAMAEGMARGAELLFGRRTYEDFFKVWPTRKDNPFTAVLDNTMKHVVSSAVTKPLPWKNSSLLRNTDAVAELKQQPGKDLVILGSGELIRSLIQRNLIDEYILMIHPLVFGEGRRMFGNDGAFAKLKLEKSIPTTSGVIIATYTTPSS
jgi:dihydrofolate reductase